MNAPPPVFGLPENRRALSDKLSSTSMPALISWLPPALTRWVSASLALRRCSMSRLSEPGPPITYARDCIGQLVMNGYGSLRPCESIWVDVPSLQPRNELVVSDS